MLKRDKKAEFLEIGIVSMKYQFVKLVPVVSKTHIERKFNLYRFAIQLKICKDWLSVLEASYIIFLLRPVHLTNVSIHLFNN